MHIREAQVFASRFDGHCVAFSAVSTLSLQRSLIASSIALRMLRGSPCRLSFNLSALSDCISMFGKCNQKGFVTLKIEFDKTRSVLQLK